MLIPLQHLFFDCSKVLDVWKKIKLWSQDKGEHIKWKFLFNDALNTFYLWLYGFRHMVKDHSGSERGNQLQPHGVPFPISSKGSFICIIPQTG